MIAVAKGQRADRALLIINPSAPSSATVPLYHPEFETAGGICTITGETRGEMHIRNSVMLACLLHEKKHKTDLLICQPPELGIVRSVRLVEMECEDGNHFTLRYMAIASTFTESAQKPSLEAMSEALELLAQKEPQVRFLREENNMPRQFGGRPLWVSKETWSKIQPMKSVFYKPEIGLA